MVSGCLINNKNIFLYLRLPRRRSWFDPRSGQKVFSIVYQWSGVPRRPSVAPRRPSTFSNILFPKTALPIKAKFYVEPPWVGGTQVCSRHLGHMTKMAATHIYGSYMVKTLKKLLLQNRQADFHEIWYVALRTPAHHSLFK